MSLFRHYAIDRIWHVGRCLCACILWINYNQVAQQKLEEQDKHLETTKGWVIILKSKKLFFARNGNIQILFLSLRL